MRDEFCLNASDEDGSVETTYYPTALPWEAVDEPSFAWLTFFPTPERPNVPAYKGVSKWSHTRPTEAVLNFLWEQPLWDLTGEREPGQDEIVYSVEYFPHTEDRPMPSRSERIFL